LIYIFVLHTFSNRFSMLSDNLFYLEQAIPSDMLTVYSSVCGLYNNKKLKSCVYVGSLISALILFRQITLFF